MHMGYYRPIIKFATLFKRQLQNRKRKKESKLGVIIPGEREKRRIKI